ncbi:MAG: hypothetical protein OHK0052_12550 [Anaerolineales bacterium]
MQRPDLSAIPEEVRAYIEYLETQVARQTPQKAARLAALAEEDEPLPEVPLDPTEPPTTINLLTLHAQTLRRTPRHLYQRQRRGGMGTLDLPEIGSNAPIFLAAADESQKVLLFTSAGRAFHWQLNRLSAAELRASGENIGARLGLQPSEHLVAALPATTQGYIILASANGMVRRLRHHLFGDYMKPGASMIDPKEFDTLVSACIASGEDDLFLVSRQGVAIRFDEKLVAPTGSRGLRLKDDDALVSVCAVREESGVFLLSADGRGTIRQMSGFTANKAPGAGGKIALKTEKLAAACTVREGDDLFVITRNGKIIRFKSAEIPPKEGVVQGVVCMSLRADECVAAFATQ